MSDNPGTIVIASGNQGKVREIRAAFAHTGLLLPTQGELDIDGASEPYATFLENALAKARRVARISGQAALSDDSGLVVPALGNAPGVHSARYSGENANDESNNAKLLAAMENIGERQAFYYACIVFLRGADDPAPVVAEGLWHGEILRAARGDGGFGYDPLFLDPRSGKTGAEMAIDEKNSVSHRGQSLRNVLAQLQRRRVVADG